MQAERVRAAAVVSQTLVGASCRHLAQIAAEAPKRAVDTPPSSSAVPSA